MQQTSQTDDPAGLLRRPRRARSRWRIGVGAAMVLVIAAAVVAVLLAGTRASGRTEVLAPAGGVTAAAGPSGAPSSTEGNATPAASSSPGEVLYVHVAGAVAAPGLYLLDPGARVADALAAAGGFTEPAERAAVNLARRLVDGEQILVPERGAAVAPGGTAPAAGGAAAAGGIVRLSTATAAQLEELPEIGPATAAKIVAYREEHGPFTSVDQLLEVPGVGEKTLEAFREQVAP
ncbi:MULTISPECIES: ComEA family DNA-binding protein [unclassified Rathayibacter]|uniref:ComEA family DNA-binding protein n=1 Tax=unclassified Rathayibacter TaxID=2609250 RepID=UPI001FB4114F|nr:MULTISPECIES: ComEA family DNA-binding protein [unclassified Rathayibacter]MCJ1673058.1 helix-hairpin-helix domain-containing protein [Rathayibacter sp. VKM Ac-2929]MCJ1685517.1 helix-hairpin-helix domain-containing protein [Rathayibacter sp. VKM Ac-2927]